jgi:hypothetical protein
MKATSEELAQAPGMNMALAQLVWEHLHEEKINNLPRKNTSRTAFIMMLL